MKNITMKRSTRRNLIAYSFIAPNFIGFAVFTLLPMLAAFVLAFSTWDGSNAIQFSGLANFKRLLGDVIFWKSLKNTLIYVVLSVPLTMAASLILALLLNQRIRFRGVFRTISILPYVGSLISITTVWTFLFHPTMGPINGLLHYVFQVQELPNWFGKNLIMVTLVSFSIWKQMGYYMVLYLAGLQGIPYELYEASEIDGASWLQQFRYITWPQLRFTTFFVLVMLTIHNFKVYDIAVMIAGGIDGKLGSSSVVLVYYIYQKAFMDWDLGYASAIALALFVIVLVVTLIQFKGQEKLGD